MQGVVSNVELDADFVGQTLVESSEKSTTTSEVNAVLHDIGVEFRRRVL